MASQPLPVANYYRTYKDTKCIASWLARTARSCRYSAELLLGDATETKTPSGRIKGKKRKELHAAASSSTLKVEEGGAPAKPAYVIPRQDFTSLAQYITASTKPLVDVPRSILETLKRAITLRKRHA